MIDGDRAWPRHPNGTRSSTSLTIRPDWRAHLQPRTVATPLIDGGGARCCTRPYSLPASSLRCRPSFAGPARQRRSCCHTQGKTPDGSPRSTASVSARSSSGPAGPAVAADAETTARSVIGRPPRDHPRRVQLFACPAPCGRSAVATHIDCCGIRRRGSSPSPCPPPSVREGERSGLTSRIAWSCM